LTYYVLQSSSNSYLHCGNFKIPTAMFYLIDNSTTIFDSRDNIIYFDYYTEEEWQQDAYTSSMLHFGYIDLSAVDTVSGYPVSVNPREVKLLRITGTMAEDGKITPTAIYSVTEEEFPLHYTPAAAKELDERGLLKWNKHFDAGAHTEDTVILYAERVKKWREYGYELRFMGKAYEDFYDMYTSKDFINVLANVLGGSAPDSSGNLLRQTIITTSWRDDFTVHTAVQTSPLLMAMLSLKYAYIFTLALAVILIFAARRVIKKQLIRPVQRVVFAADNMYDCPDDPASGRLWQETQQLIELYDRLFLLYTRTHDENTSLRVSLDYSKQAEQYRRRLTSNLTHELKTPLAVLRSYAEGLKEHIAEDKRDKYVDVILAQIEQTDSMIHSMLDLSRLEAGKVRLKRESFDLSGLAAETLERFELMRAEKDLKITTLLSPCTVHADRGRIGQVVENLISNAVKYTPAGGNIELSVYEGKKGVYFSVKNDCEPLSAEELAQVFEPFYRADSSRSSEGTGLGLSIAKNIIEMHGGKMTAKSYGGSAEFGFSL
ncbi:MAG: HAMP domain-containing histidine kinase, partial [Clostridia bacterium]|nr:HAMP domain-containing histidine kinase [Clostridia bacterium]